MIETTLASLILVSVNVMHLLNSFLCLAVLLPRDVFHSRGFISFYKSVLEEETSSRKTLVVSDPVHLFIYLLKI